LRSLNVWVETESHGAMAQVGLFEHVKKLRIVPCQSASLVDPLTDEPSWNMPAVTHLWWHDSWNELIHGARFISRCRFPRLTHLDVEKFDPRGGFEGTPHICYFLDAHRSITYLRLWVRDEWQPVSIVPFVRARNLQICCFPRCPPRAFVPLLRPEVKTLGLEFNRSIWKHLGHESKTSLWELLRQFATEDDTPPTLETIRLLANDVDGPGPGNDSLREERFLRTLRSHVLRLNARGIRIFVHDDQICV
jgi:hypothetical protein